MSLSLPTSGQRQLYRSMSVADLVLGTMLAFVGLYAIASLFLPFGWDQAILASVGQAMAEGGLPFRDSWDMKGPWAYVPFAVSDLLFGQVMWGIRLIELFILAPALYLTFRLVEAYTSSHIGAWSAVALFLWIASAGWFATAEPEVWIAALSVVAFYPFLVPRTAPPGWGIALLVGLLIGIAGLVKPFYLAYGAVPVAAAVTASGFSWRFAIHNGFWVGVGIVATLLVTAAYLWSLGGLMEAIDVHLGFTASAYWETGNAIDFLKAAVEVPTQGTFTVTAPFVALGLWSLRTNVRLLAPMAVWLGLGLFFALVQAKFFTYHWFPFYVPYVILAALGVGALLKPTSDSHAARIAVFGTCFVFFAQISAVPARELYRLGGWAAGLYSTQSQYDRYWFLSYTVGDQLRAAEHIKANTEQGDTVYVYGVDATARYLSDRPNATRFTFNMPITVNGPYRDRYRQEMMQELSEKPPAYIIVGLPWEIDNTKASFYAFKEFHDFVMSGYTLEKQYGIVDLYRRKSP